MCDQALGEFRVDAPVSAFVSIRERRSPDRSAEAHVPELARLSRETGLNIPQTLAISQLSERHGAILFSAGEGLHRMISTVARDDPRERAPLQAIHKLRK